MQANTSPMKEALAATGETETRNRLYSSEALVSNDFADMPIIDMSLLLEHSREHPDCPTQELPAAVRSECQKVADCLHNFGILLIKDPRVDFKANDDYVDLMEDYFYKTGELFYAGEKVDDIKPEVMYQVGATPENIELARNHSEKIKSLNLAPEDMPQSPEEPVKDAKWRFMWKIGERPEGAADDFPQVVPQAFPDWENRMNTWGGKLNKAVFAVAEMAAIGMGVPRDTFIKRLEGGAHLLAPTGSDLEKNDVGAVFAGFHYDISFLTIHGKSRYPGLSVWTRDWKKRAVKIPQGCLLVQAGTTFENISGGYVLGGFHEVIYTEATKAAVERRRQALQEAGDNRKQWRVSSTMFTHFRNDVCVGPLPELSHLYSKEEAAKYDNITAYEILVRELSATGMTDEATCL